MQHDGGDQPGEHDPHGTGTPWRTGPGAPVVVGHRGAADLAPPNSVAAIHAAVAAGADAVELDVRRAPDGRLVLGHGRRSARRAGALPAATGFAVLRDAAPGLGLLADVKAAGIEVDLVAALRDAGLTGRTVVCARRVGVLRRLGELDPGLARAWSLKHPRHAAAGRLGTAWRDVPGAAAAALRLGLAEAVAVHHALVSPLLVRRVHDAGGLVYVWGLRRVGQTAEVAELGVDAVIVDDPRRSAQRG